MRRQTWAEQGYSPRVIRFRQVGLILSGVGFVILVVGTALFAALIHTRALFPWMIGAIGWAVGLAGFVVGGQAFVIERHEIARRVAEADAAAALAAESGGSRRLAAASDGSVLALLAPPGPRWLFPRARGAGYDRHTRSRRRDATVSFQSYLDNVEEKTGLTPRQFMALAHERDLDAPGVKAGAILEWLKTDYDLGRGHGMALVHVIQSGAKISDKHVGTGTTHSDPSNELWLDGKATKPAGY